MYKLGTLEQFTLEDTVAKNAAGWTNGEIESGKLVAYEEDGEVFKSTIINLIPKEQNPDGSDEYLWESVNGDIEDPFNILSVWNKRIIKPVPPKYYIALRNHCSITQTGDRDCYIYGVVQSSQVVNFGSNVANIEIFDTEAEYFARIAELGIEINDLEY